VGRLSGLQFVRKLNLSGDQGVGYLFTRGDTSVLTAWTRSDVPALALTIKTPKSDSIVEVWDIWGDKVDVTAVNGVAHVGLSPWTQYIEIPGGAGAIAVEAPLTEGTTGMRLARGMDNRVSLNIPDRKQFPAQARMRLIAPDGWKVTPAGEAVFSVRPGDDYPLNQQYPVRIEAADGEKVYAVQPLDVELSEPLEMSVGLDWSGTTPALSVKIANRGSVLSGTLKVINQLTKGLRPERLSKALKIAGGRSMEVTLPLDCYGQRPDAYPVTVTLENDKGVLAGAERYVTAMGVTKAKNPHPADGALVSPTWQGVAPQVMDSRIWLDGNEFANTMGFFYRAEQNDGTWTGPEMFSVKLYQQWDDDNYYLRAVVKDRQHLNPYIGAGIWSGDALQLRFRKVTADGKNPQTFYSVALNGRNEAEVWRHAGNELCPATGDIPGIKRAIVRHETEQTTVYDLVFPKAEIAPVSLKAGATVQVSIVVLNRINEMGLDPMVMRWGRSIYCPGGEDVEVTLVP